MLETIGEPRTYEHISGGFQFAGGFPEIFFELFGPLYAWPFIFGAGYIAAGLTAVVVKGVIQGRYASAFLSLYVLFGFYVMYIGGMLNFIMTPIYWIKIAALAIALLMEASLARAGLPLIPWALFRVPGQVKDRVGQGLTTLEVAIGQILSAFSIDFKDNHGVRMRSSCAGWLDSAAVSPILSAKSFLVCKRKLRRM